jgi:hypothetical protein
MQPALRALAGYTRWFASTGSDCLHSNADESAKFFAGYFPESKQQCSAGQSVLPTQSSLPSLVQNLVNQRGG